MALASIMHAYSTYSQEKKMDTLSAEITNLLTLKYISHLPLWQEIYTVSHGKLQCFKMIEDNKCVIQLWWREQITISSHLSAEDILDLQ